ncbi:MAG: hypothetical protein N2645_10750 [Clostridia bacterium]|nr:hypothetical protein [Clostridia bacterium]
MAEVYFYIPADQADNAVTCGLKLSKWSDKEIWIDGDFKKCISALLNPKDEMEKYRSSEYKCLKLELDSKYCFVGDKYLYQVGLEFPQVMDMYQESVMPVDKYIFGSFRLPECLVTSTIIEGQISILDKRLDSPVLFDKSEDLYVNNILENYKETHADFNDALLYYFYSKLAECGKVDKIEDSEKRIAIFLDKESQKAYTIKMPEISRY